MTGETQMTQIPTSFSSEIAPQELTEIVNVNTICRVCGNQTDKLLGIFSENCLTNELPSKLNLYLPVKVTEGDVLPLQVCWSCATTVLTWHDFVVTCAEVDKKLRSYQVIITEKQLPVVAGNGLPTEESAMVLTSISDGLHSISESHQLVNNFIEKYTKELALVTTSNNLPEHPTQNECVQQEFDTHVEDKTSLEEDAKEEIFENMDSCPTISSPRVKDEIEHAASISPKKDEDEEVLAYGCLYCPNVFDAEVNVRDHLKHEHPYMDFGNGNCDLSEMITVSKYHINSEETEDEQVRRQLSKERIRKNNKIDQELVNSAKVKVGNKVYYNCKECGKSLHSRYTYVWHVRIHTGERPYICDLCGKQFRVSQGLIRHLKETHARIKKFPCDLCNRYFTTRRNVEEHRRTHTNERPYVCDLCGKSFKQKASLFVHNRSHTNVFPFECNYCSATFRTKPLLNGHLTKHTGEKPHPCDVCGRQFRIKYELKRHKLIHSDDKPFLCTLCKTHFRQKRYLRNHLKYNHQGYSLEDTSEGTIIVEETKLI